MKKLSLIAGLACLATVGGVFGAWVYGGTTVAGDYVDSQIGITTDTEVVSPYGAVDVGVTGGVTSAEYTQTTANAAAVTSEFGGTEDYAVTITDNNDYATAGLAATYTVVLSVEMDESIKGYFVGKSTDGAVIAKYTQTATTKTYTFERELVENWITFRAAGLADATEAQGWVDAYEALGAGALFTVKFTVTVAVA